MPPVGFEPTIWAGERPQTYALDRAATGTGTQYNTSHNDDVYFQWYNSNIGILRVHFQMIRKTPCSSE